MCDGERRVVPACTRNGCACLPDSRPALVHPASTENGRRFGCRAAQSATFIPQERQTGCTGVPIILCTRPGARPCLLTRHERVAGAGGCPPSRPIQHVNDNALHSTARPGRPRRGAKTFRPAGLWTSPSPCNRHGQIVPSLDPAMPRSSSLRDPGSRTCRAPTNRPTACSIRIITCQA